MLLLPQRKKTEMEDLFSAAFPQQQRGGSRFVFRQGNPLNAGDLKLVAAGGRHVEGQAQGQPTPFKIVDHCI
jgi:hypothetical protein